VKTSPELPLFELMTTVHTAPCPSLLDRLPPVDRERLSAGLQLVTLERDQVLYQAGQAVPSVFFPVTALIEEVLPQREGDAHMLRRVDARSMAGSCALGDAVTTRTARVCDQGQAYRMGYADFVRALDEVRSFRELVMQDAAAAVMACGRP
jgi:CRP-like cAMP-binding protein